MEKEQPTLEQINFYTHRNIMFIYGHTWQQMEANRVKRLEELGDALSMEQEYGETVNIQKYTLYRRF